MIPAASRSQQHSGRFTLEEGTPPGSLDRRSSAYKRRQQADESPRSSAYKRRQQTDGNRGRQRSSTRDVDSPRYRKTEAEREGKENQGLGGDQDEHGGGCGRFVNDLLPGLVGAAAVGCGCMWKWEVISPVLFHECVYTMACWAPWPEVSYSAPPNPHLILTSSPQSSPHPHLILRNRALR